MLGAIFGNVFIFPPIVFPTWMIFKWTYIIFGQMLKYVFLEAFDLGVTRTHVGRHLWNLLPCVSLYIFFTL